jgi:nitric oxide reductase subunit C
MNEVRCLTCHSIRGRGGRFAPDLSFEGSSVEKEWLKAFLKSPDVIRPLLKQMPQFNLTETEATILADYVKAVLVDDRIPEDPWPGRTTSRDDIARGQRLYEEKGCVACHQVGMRGGVVGPNLTNVGRRLTSGYLSTWIKDARAFRPNIVEPKQKWEDTEIFSLTGFLKGLTGAPQLSSRSR